ncbi:MAG TPA: PD-(D/E)XK nuclease family protein [Chloroflexota bacterium]|nr:PD-(D/E)XK nuclease family protein [Chloroflexota bacterium]
MPIRFRELPRPFVEAQTLEVSYSGIDAYQACPRRFFYGHVLHVQDPSRGANTTLGNKVHAALLALNRQWMEEGEPPRDDAVQAVWREVWPIDRATIEAALADPETRVRWEPGFVFPRQVVQGWQRGAGQLRRYFAWERLRWTGMHHRPVALEQPFQFELNGHVIVGRIDCVLQTGGGDVVIDYKTGKPKNGRKPEKSLQLAIYEEAWRLQSGANPAVAYYHLAADDDQPGQPLDPWRADKQARQTRYTVEMRDTLWAEIVGALDRITANDFAAAPKEGRSTCDACAYRLWCEESLA